MKSHLLLPPSQLPACELLVHGMPGRHIPVYIPFFHSKIPAGFPSPADDYNDKKISLDEELITNRFSTFFCKVTGDSMKDVGIYEDTLLIVDRSVMAREGDIIIAVLNSEFTCKRMGKKEGKTFLLHSENKDKNYPDIIITEDMEFFVWGVVTSAVNSFLKKL